MVNDFCLIRTCQYTIFTLHPYRSIHHIYTSSVQVHTPYLHFILAGPYTIFTITCTVTLASFKLVSNMYHNKQSRLRSPISIFSDFLAKSYYHFLLHAIDDIIEFMFLPDSAVCGQTNQTGTSGVLSSPNYPHNYDSHTLCIYYIEAPEDTQVWDLKFLKAVQYISFWLDTGTYGCPLAL